jgi:VCBS repeat-containing protein
MNVTVSEDGVLSGSLNGSDPEGCSVVFAPGAVASNGTAVVNADGSYSYTPSSDYSGPDSFTYTVTDTEGASVTSTVYVTVEGVAETPGLSVRDASGVEDSAIALEITASSSDASEAVSVEVSGVPSGAILSAGVDQGNGTWVVQSADLGGLTLTPAEDFAGTLDLVVTAIA